MVTLVVGESYSTIWRQVCELNWQRYAEKYHLDLIYLSQPLDTSKRVQKCLILSQDFAQRYEQVVWMDADIMINNRTAPNVLEGVPVEKVGAAQEFCLSHTEPKTARELLDRIREFWPHLRSTGLIAASGADPRDIVPLVDQVLDMCFKIGLRLDQRIAGRREIADRAPRPASVIGSHIDDVSRL